MGPKTRTAKGKAEPEATKQAEEPPQGNAPADATLEADGGTKAEAQTETKQEGTEAKPSKKRKKTSTTSEPQKAARRSGRGAPKSKPSQGQLLKFMLSRNAEELCRPNDETEDIDSRGNIRTYSSSVLNPFEELLSAVILSRPISHRLGLRTIRTVLNDPYNFTSAKAIRDTGPEKVHQSVWDARTQHKEKTATEMSQVADVVLEKFTAEGVEDEEGKEMQKVRSDCSHDAEKEREYIKSSIKGVGKTGMDIFFRRVQWMWEEAFPFVDERTMSSLHKLGLPEDSEELVKVLDQHWSELETKHLAGDGDEVKKRRAFTTILERATGSDLEGKTEALLEAAAAAP